MKPLKKILSSFSDNCTGFLFPRICIKCRNTAAEGTGIAAWLCGSCISSLGKNLDARAAGRACPYCAQNLLAGACGCETAALRPYDGMYSLFDFDDTLKTVVHEFKYNGFKRLAFIMGKTYADRIPSLFFEGMDMITTVPLHFFRRIKRGYNQVDFFAQGIVAGAGLSIPLVRGVLARKRPTKTQTNLSRGDRLNNVKGAFIARAAGKDFFKAKNVILVDDVVTTGATTGQCAAVLRRAGAKSVRVLSLARD
jgi:competence protein ComFC